MGSQQMLVKATLWEISLLRALLTSTFCLSFQVVMALFLCCQNLSGYIVIALFGAGKRERSREKCPEQI
jgi:hypothetical protein